MKNKPSKQLTAPAITDKKGKEKIVMLTAYDFTMASLIDPFVDVILVGDTLGCVVQGNKNTLSVSLEQMIYHGSMVASAAKQALIVGDLPFGSYQVSSEQAMKSALELMKKAGVGAVKLEGGRRSCESIERISAAGIPVMGHIGLTPQSIHGIGGNKVQGRLEVEAELLIEDAKAIDAAGTFAIVLEAVPAELAAKITHAVSIPTIGIGAGPHCDGQVLVVNDMIGLNTETAAMKFNKEFCQVRNLIQTAVENYANEVKTNRFPAQLHCYGAPNSN